MKEHLCVSKIFWMYVSKFSWSLWPLTRTSDLYLPFEFCFAKKWCAQNKPWTGLISSKSNVKIFHWKTLFWPFFGLFLPFLNKQELLLKIHLSQLISATVNWLWEKLVTNEQLERQLEGQVRIHWTSPVGVLKINMGILIWYHDRFIILIP